MTIKSHKGNTKTFRELDNPGQARSVTAMTNHLIDAVNARITRAKEDGKDHKEIKDKFVKQILRGILRLKD